MTRFRHWLTGLNKRPRVFERRGARWMLDPTDWLDWKIIIDQPYEVKQLRRFTQMAEAARPTRFFDIGANWGLYTVLMGKAFPQMELHCFEPVRATRMRLALNLALNQMTDRVATHAVAASDAAGEAEIEISPGSLCISSLSASEEERAERNFTMSEMVMLKRFDDIIEVTGERLLFKIDVEGHEVAALAGMPRTLAQNDCFLQVETRARNHDAVLSLMQGAGYSQVDGIKEDLYFQR